MSIIKSVRAGKAGIKITKEYLLSKGWYVGYIDKIHPPTQMRKKEFNQQYLKIELTNDGPKFIIKLVFNKTEQNEYYTRTYIESVADYDLVMKFWNEKNPKKKIKYKNQIAAKCFEKVNDSKWWYYSGEEFSPLKTVISDNTETLKNTLKHKVVYTKI